MDIVMGNWHFKLWEIDISSSVEMSGVLHVHRSLKIGAQIILLRNLNATKLKLTSLGGYVFEVLLSWVQLE